VCQPPWLLLLSQEVAAARTISQRGVLLVGTAHGTCLANVLQNPELQPLVGGVTTLTLGDAAANLQGGGRKVGAGGIV
jgi:stage III sporulation protein SpoIIIAA